MVLTPKFQGKIENGELVVDDALGYREHLIALGSRPDPRVEVVVRQLRRRRSVNENRYYMGVVLKVLEDYTGHTKDELHEAMKAMFLSYEDGGIKYTKSTTDLSTVEMEEYMENIRRWANETLSVYIPLPNEVEMT